MSDLACALIEEALRPRVDNDRDYDARATVGDGFAAEMQAYRATSDAVKPEYLAHADVTYDAQSGQSLDIFGTDGQGRLRPVFIFIHGGYWRALSKLDSSMMAATLAAEGIASVAIDYQLAPAVHMREIVRQVRAAIAFIWKNGARYGLDPDQIHIGGSSAGGHLTAMVLAGGWHAAFGVPENVVKSAFPISGLYELAPIAAGFAQDWLQLDADDVAELSPIRHLPARGCPIVVTWAEGEAPGFKRQSRAFHQTWSEAGFPSTAFEIAGCNHFDALVEMANPQSRASLALIDLIRQSGSA